MTGIRTLARQNLLVATINAAIEQGHVTLECTATASDPVIFEFTIDGMPVIASAKTLFIDFVEVDFRAICCPNDYGREHVAYASAMSKKSHYGAAVVSGLLERGNGKYLHEFGTHYRGQQEITERIAALTVKPLGFAIHPPARRKAVRR